MLPPQPRAGLKPDAKTLQAAAADAGLVLPDAAIQAFRDGRMIEAIKQIRTANPGLDLARAKAAMERLQVAQRSAAGTDPKPPREGQHRPAPVHARDTRTPTVEMGDAPGQLRWLLVVVVVLVVATWIAFGGMPG